jgi:hypothetical protein
MLVGTSKCNSVRRMYFLSVLFKPENDGQRLRGLKRAHPPTRIT